jgi:hypothetical protein
MLFRIAVYALPHRYLCPSAPLELCFSKPGGNAPDIKLLIFSNLIKSLKFAKISPGGRLFHFKGSISVKKLACSLCFCPKVSISDKNQAHIYCSK